MGNFVETATWKGLPEGEMSAVYGLIGPSIRKSPRKEAKRVAPEITYAPLEPGKLIGRVTFYDNEKGFGRINGETYFHARDFADFNSRFVYEGVQVAYRIGINERNGREKAVAIQLVEPTNNEKGAK